MVVGWLEGVEWEGLRKFDEEGVRLGQERLLKRWVHGEVEILGLMGWVRGLIGLVFVV